MERVKRILVVCTSNVCRSPLAEALLQRGLVARGLRDVWVESAGTAGFSGLPVSSGMIDYARAIGLDLTAHRSSPLGPAQATEADLILCMEEHHREAVLKMVPAAADRTCLLTHFLTPPLQDQEIVDPHPVGRTAYRTIGERIVEACRAVMDAARLAEPPSGSPACGPTEQS